MSSEEIAARIASISVDAPPDRLDIDAVVRAGKNRRWQQRIAAAGAFACVAAAIAGSVFLAPAKHPAPPVFGPTQSLTAEQLAGRWLATSIDGTDASSLPDMNALPPNIIIGADGSPGEWVVNAVCPSPRRGTFALRPDGSFAVTSVARLPVIFCPNETGADLRDDLTGLLKRTAFVTVDPESSSSARTMRFLDRQRKVIAVWREDVALRSPASICEKALGTGATSDGTFTTAAQTLQTNGVDHLSPTAIRINQVLPNVSGDDVVVYCDVASARYAVTTGGQKVLLKPAK